MNHFLSLCLAIVVSVSSIQVKAAPSDIISDHEPFYIKITLNDNKTMVRFDYCRSDDQSCIRIGKKEYYKVEILEAQYIKENRQAIALAFGSGVVILGATYASGGIAMALDVGVGGILSTGMITFSVGTGVTLFMDTFNPVYQENQAFVISKESLSDQEIKTTCKIKNIKKALESVLEKVE